MVPELELQEFCHTGTGGTPSRTQPLDFFGGNIPWVKSGELKEEVILTTEEFVTKRGVEAARLRIVPKGSILVAMYGATVGRTAILGVDATTNQAVCHVRPDPKKADTQYVWFALQAKLPEFLAQRVGGAQPNIGQGTIRTTRIRLPSLPEQRRIADILSKSDTIRRKRKQAIALTEELLRSAFLDMFGDPVTNPKGWPVKPLRELASAIDYGVTASAITQPVGPRFLRITDIQDNRVNWAKVPYCECDSATADRARLAPGDIVFARTGATTGKSFCVRDCPEDAVFASYLIRVRPGPSVLPAYLSEFFQSAGYWAQVRAMAEGAAQPGVNASKLASLRVVVPPLAAQARMSTAAVSVARLQAQVERGVVKADMLFNSLIARAFSGTSEVPC